MTQITKIKMGPNKSSPTLGLCGRLKCCRFRLDSACWGSSVWGMFPEAGEVEGVEEPLCLWWERLSLQTKDPRWVHCHRLQRKHTSHVSGGKKYAVKYDIFEGWWSRQKAKYQKVDVITPTTLCSWQTRPCSIY